MRFFVAMLFLLPVVLPTAACGGSDAQCVIDTDCPLFNRCMEQQCVPLGGGDPDSAIADSGVMDSSVVDSSTPDTGVDSGAPDLGRGTVQLLQTPNPVMATHTMTAAFTATGTSDVCTVTDLSPCVMTECIYAPPPVTDGGTPDAGMVDAGPPPSLPSAGMITTTGGMVDVSVTPGATGIYPVTAGVGLVFNGGEALTMTAAGEGVPAFSGNVPAPYAVTVSAPSFMSPPLSIDRGTDLTVTWASVEADPGLVTVVVTGSGTVMGTGTRTVTLLCAFAGADSTGTILASHLANLPSGTGSLSIGTSNLQRVTASGWTVDLSASLVATSDTGNPALAPTLYP